MHGAEDRTRDRIQLRINGTSANVQARTLATLLDELGFAGQRVATARNGSFVPAAGRATQDLVDGDEIEIVSARQGG